MPKRTINNLSKNPRPHGTPGTRWAVDAPPEKKACEVCVGVVGVREENGVLACRDCRAVAKNQVAHHGTNARYRNGCDCGPCLKAHRDYHRGYLRTREVAT